MKKVSKLIVLTFFFASCGQSHQTEAERARIEAESYEKQVEAERRTRERKQSFNNSEKYLKEWKQHS